MPMVTKVLFIMDEKCDIKAVAVSVYLLKME